MSLFKTKQWWRTDCGVDETFDRRSLLIAPLFGAERKDLILVGSHSGFLRIYQPSTQWIEETKSPTDYKTTDLIIESKLCDCIVDMKVGKFVSGSQELHLAVLSPSKVLVYTTSLTNGATEEGDHCDLKISYEHDLPRFPATLTTGPFGGARGRDFLCVQCLDGTLLFYEQEIFAFSLVLRNRLLAEPIVYVSRNDVFVTSSSSWYLECYRYQNMAEFGRSKDRASASSNSASSPEPDWSCNIGEAVLDIDTVTLSSFEVGILVLGERSLYCLKDNHLAVKHAKRLEYKPLCFAAYVIEPDGKLMVLVIAETSTLMIHEGTTLRWSAQLPFAPVAVVRAHLQHLQGATVILSEDGILEVCYLGSEPSMFIAPPVHRRGYDYAAAEEELLQLRTLLKKNKASGDPLSEATTDAELIVTLTVSPDLEPSPRIGVDRSKDDAPEGHEFACTLIAELSSYASLTDVQIAFDVYKPLRTTKTHHVIPNLCDRNLVQTTVYIEGDAPPISSEIKVTVSYKTDRGQLRVLRKSAQLPLKMMLRPCPPENTSSFTATIKCNEPLISFTQLFPEFVGQNLHRQNSSGLGLRHVQSGHVVTIVSGSTSNRYRVQSNDGLSMTLVVQQLVSRLKERTKPGTVIASVSQNHIQLVHSQMEAHFHSRQEIDRITNELGLLTTQLRNIERKLLRAARERNARSLADTGLPFLLESTYSTISTFLDDLATAKAERERRAHDLQTSLRLLLVLLGSSGNDKLAIFEAAIGFEPQLRDDVGWEEIADVTLTAFLRSTSKKTGNTETKPLAWNRITTSKELAKLKKRLVHAIERLDTYRESDIAENEPSDASNLSSA